MPNLFTNIPNPYGQAWSCTSDLTMPAVMVTGFRVVAEAIYRRWVTPRGDLVDDPNYGYDLTGFLQKGVTPGDLGRIAKLAGLEAEKDERVLRCEVQISLDAKGTLTVEAEVTTNVGPFQMVLSVSQVTVELLNVTWS